MDAEEARARLRRAAAIRSRCQRLLAAGQAGELRHFEVHLERIVEAVAVTDRVARERYPELVIPGHGRLAHFRAGGIDRLAPLGLARAERGAAADPRAARSLADLVVLSVLLDAGAGARWRYLPAGESVPLARSEGLAVASLGAFAAGLFSSDPAAPLRVDGCALRQLSVEALGLSLQHSEANPVLGLAGRFELLQRLGSRLEAAPEYFGGGDRLGGLCDFLASRATGGRLPAQRLLELVLEALGPVWPARSRIGGLELGDVWPHYAAGGEGLDAGWLPLHKLTQWLCYSLFDVLSWYGLEVTERHQLTGLPEYRNGGLFLDTGVLSLRDPQAAGRTHRPDGELVIEWRGLTVALLDHLAGALRRQWRRSEAELSLAQVLEAGSWAAGRRIAQERRPGGPPPLIVESDGTLF